jgi:hypothetical protein
VISCHQLDHHISKDHDIWWNLEKKEGARRAWKNAGLIRSWQFRWKDSYKAYTDRLINGRFSETESMEPVDGKEIKG